MCINIDVFLITLFHVSYYETVRMAHVLCLETHKGFFYCSISFGNVYMGYTYCWWCPCRHRCRPKVRRNRKTNRAKNCTPLKLRECERVDIVLIEVHDDEAARGWSYFVAFCTPLLLNPPLPSDGWQGIWTNTLLSNTLFLQPPPPLSSHPFSPSLSLTHKHTHAHTHTGIGTPVESLMRTDLA